MKYIRVRDDEGYRKDGSNPVDDAIAKRNAARRKFAARKAQSGDKNKDPKKKNEEVDEVEEAKTGSPAWWRAEKERESKLDIRTRVTNRVANAAKDGQKIETSIQARKRRARAEKANEEFDQVDEGGMIGRTKPSRELNVQKDEKPHLAGVNSLKFQKRAAHKAERKKGKKDIKKGD